MPTEIFTVSCNGQGFASFLQISVHGAMKLAARGVTFTVAAEQGPQAVPYLFPLFAPVQVKIGADLAFNGHIVNRHPQLGPTGPASIAIGAAAKGADAVDCHPIHPTGRFENMSMLQILQQLDQFNIGFSSDVNLPTLPEFQIQEGETLFRIGERLARQHIVTLVGQPDGSIKITNASSSTPRHAGGLFEGLNIKHGNSHFGAENRHSKTHARGQSYHGHGASAMALESIAADSEVPRNRTHVLPVDGHQTKAHLTGRATHRRNRAAGNGTRAEIITPFCRDQGGKLWTPGWKVWVESPFLELAQDMLVESVVFLQDGKGEGGTLAHIGLVDPRAYAGHAGAVNQSSDGWAMDSSSAS